VQQLREAFSFGSAPRFLIFNRDRKYGVEVPAAVRSLGIEAIQTEYELVRLIDLIPSLASRHC
jgi:hypothetical protein